MIPSTIETQQPDIRVVQHLQRLAEADNLASEISEEDLSTLGREVIEMFDLDKASMAEMDETLDKALELAKLTKKDKTYPWPNASNICYPLITTAAVQYNARAYPAIVPSTDVVKVAVHGQDDGTKADRARRVSSFMSWQLKVDSREWERGTDQLTLQLPILADVFRKLWWDPVKDQLRSQIRLPGKHIVINNNCTTMGTAPRVSDQIKLYPYQVDANIRSGRYVEFTYTQDGEDTQEPEEFIEQLLRKDLDGDGYAEPYIVTVHKDTKTVVRVVTAWSMETIQLGPQGVMDAEVFGYLIHYQFMPSMDGGFWGTGFGSLLGDISESVNSTLNILMDSGHMQSLGGGFIGAKDFRLKGGSSRFRPGEYKQVTFTGDDVRKGIVPLDFPGPSPVLFQMLGMLTDAGREIASVSDVMTGDTASASLPVGTVMALIEEGHRVFTASYKRIYRSLQDEFELIAKLNAKHVKPEKYQGYLDEQADPKQDFDLVGMDITPVADPQAVTSMQRMGRSQFLLELAQQGMLDPMAVTVRVLDAASIESPKSFCRSPTRRRMRWPWLRKSFWSSKSSRKRRTSKKRWPPRCRSLRTQRPQRQRPIWRPCGCALRP